MTAAIVIDNGTDPPVTGSSDEVNARLSVVHTLSNFDDTGVLGWEWTLLDKPIGSSAVLSAQFTASTTITPDVAGSYFVRLRTFTDAGRTTLDAVDEQVIGIRFPTPFDWLVPAAGETDQQGTRGWAQSREEAIRSVIGNLWPLPTATKVGAYTAQRGDLVLYDPSGGTFQIDAPASPVKGDRFAVKNVTTDVTGVTISGNGNNIENPLASTLVASYSLGVALGAIDYLFDGTNWVAL